ncbi:MULTISPECIES: hypothetical protein [Cytobacillus]|uniref:hypothetical protein n=1 Tax=Cytobacillus TaxID=2675230 RepID=UPI00203F44C9|nr:hypothetical protein [Cytobacillus kochii]MCM3324860.1 hypothetical protein [Cytobacillus kochii]MCM3347253.1 hypothetical protein [Cytobacillus kochii]MDM5205967.1 hypothetical protein [Cytobacillus kochii]
MKNFIEKVNGKMQALYARTQKAVNNEDGVSTIEWVGLAAVIVALMFAVATAMDGQGSGLAETIVTKISDMLESIGS